MGSEPLESSDDPEAKKWTVVNKHCDSPDGVGYSLRLTGDGVVVRADIATLYRNQEVQALTL